MQTGWVDRQQSIRFYSEPSKGISFWRMDALIFFMKWLELFENYLISENGNVKNQKTGRVLKNGRNQKGYNHTQVSIDGRCKTIIIHRKVYETFIGSIPLGYEVNHIDGNKENNHFTNLELLTHKDNMIHAVRTGLIKSGFDNKLSKPLAEFRPNGDIFFYGSTVEAGKKLGKAHALISLCANGKRRSAYGSKWMHISELIRLTDKK